MLEGKRVILRNVEQEIETQYFASNKLDQNLLKK